LQSRRSYTVLIPIAAGIMLVATHPRFVLVALAYSYLLSAFIGMAIARLRHRDDAGAHPPASKDRDPGLTREA
jgi:hypothetical protein